MRAVAMEIERKFLLRGDAWRALAERREAMRQGYLGGNARASVRVRIAGNAAWLNVKSGGIKAARREYEYAIPHADAAELLDYACDRPLIEKTRHWVVVEGFTFEVDEFHGENAGLVVAELELDSLEQPFPRPAWLGDEVTELVRYYNVSLVRHPYSAWSESERHPFASS